MSRFLILLILALSASADEKRTLEETLLADTSGYDLLQSFVVSDDLKRVAFGVEREDGKQLVVADGKEGPPYLSVGTPSFTPDGRLVYVARVSPGKQAVVVDGTASKAFDDIESLSIDAGKRFAYVARQGRQAVVVIDGKEHGPFDAAGPVAFSPDGSRFAFAALDRRNATWTLVIDGGEPLTGCADLGGLAWSRDGQRMAVVCRRGRENIVYLDGKPVNSFKEWAGEPTFSPDGKRFAYVARKGFAVFVDGKEHYGGPYDNVVFSPDGKRVAWTEEGNVFVDGVKQLPDRGPFALRRFRVTFSHDSQRVAFVTHDDPKTPWDQAVIDGKIQKRYDEKKPLWGAKVRRLHALIGDVIFSPDSKRAAYWACEGWDTKCTVTVDGTEGPFFERIRGLRWESPASLRYAGSREGKIYAVRETVE